ncbi:hypothetical protein KR074_010155, partial [Drosophila pseudoananassae]
PGPAGSLHIYTDGSKLNGQVGGGFHCERLCLNESFRLPDHCSVFQAEVIAIGEALRSPALTGNQDTICIFSDSQAALKALDGFS